MKSSTDSCRVFSAFQFWPEVAPSTTNFYVARPSKQDISPQCPASDLQAIRFSFTTFHLKEKNPPDWNVLRLGFVQKKSLEQDIFVSWLSDFAFILVRMNSQR